MKTGRDLQSLVQEVERQNKAKADYRAPTKLLEMTPTGSLKVGEIPFPLQVNPLAHGQLSTWAGIPKSYYDRLLTEEPNLLATNVNTFLAKSPDVRMVRTLDGRVRAFMSDRYQRMDYHEMLQATLPVLAGMNIEVMSSEITERRLYLKCIFKEQALHVPGSTRTDDIVHNGLTLSNSEVGSGSLKLEEFYYFRACTNGMMGERSLRKYHVGRALDSDAFEIKEDTQRATDKAIWLQLRDALSDISDMEKFRTRVHAMGQTTQRKIEGDPVKAVELICSDHSLSEDIQGGIMRHLIQGGDLSQWGLINAITRTAEDQDDYEKATDLERLGGNMVHMSQPQWLKVANA